MTEKYTKEYSLNSLKEAYLKYYDFVVETSPYSPPKNGYDYNIAPLIKNLPSEFLLHTTGNNPIEIVSLASAKELWERAIAEIDYNPKLSDKDKSMETDYPPFREDEFQSPLTVEKLCKVITADYDNASVQAPINTVNWLNELLTIPNLYDILNAKRPDNIFARGEENAKAKGLTCVYKVEDYRNEVFSDLKKDKQDEIKSLNRLVLEAHYPNDAPNHRARSDERSRLIKARKVEIYLLPEHKKHIEKLELKTQDTPVSTPQKGKTKDVIPFPTPPGTQWHEVTISFIDTENVEISARGKTGKRHFFDMGFRKGKTCKAVGSWDALLAFSEKEYLKFSQDTKEKTEKVIQDLRKRLKAYFGIPDDPIILKHGYKPVFKVCWGESESPSRSVHAFSNSDIFDEKEDD